MGRVGGGSHATVIGAGRRIGALGANAPRRTSRNEVDQHRRGNTDRSVPTVEHKRRDRRSRRMGAEGENVSVTVGGRPRRSSRPLSPRQRRWEKHKVARSRFGARRTERFSGCSGCDDRPGTAWPCGKQRRVAPASKIDKTARMGRLRTAFLPAFPHPSNDFKHDRGPHPSQHVQGLHGSRSASAGTAGATLPGLGSPTAWVVPRSC